MRTTTAKWMTRAIRKIAHWCRVHRHRPIPEQHRHLCAAVRGHDAYYGITGNDRSLSGCRQAVTRIWKKWLSRRSWRGQLNWTEFRRIQENFPLPPPRIVHSVYRRVAKP